MMSDEFWIISLKTHFIQTTPKLFHTYELFGALGTKKSKNKIRIIINKEIIFK